MAQAVYEWNYPRQLLDIRLLEATQALDRQNAARDSEKNSVDSASSPDPRSPAPDSLAAQLFTEAFLIKRPLLRALEAPAGRPPVLLIDEIDRADEEFEGYLLELLSDFQVTIPELGTVRAETRPIVIITSNRTREVHDALKRRCLYCWIEYPEFDKELRIVRARVPGLPERLAAQVTAFVQELRSVELYKPAGVSETLDWAAALVTLNSSVLDAAIVDQTIGVLLKNQEDIAAVRGERLEALVGRALTRA